MNTVELKTPQLKAAIEAALELAFQLQSEHKIGMGPSEIMRVAAMLFIEYCRHPENGKSGVAVNTQQADVPATEPQLAFLKKWGPKNLIFHGLSKTKAFSLIAEIQKGWNSKSVQ